MSAALSVLISRNSSKIFLRARRTLKFSHSLGQKRPWRQVHAMSALPPIPDIRRRIHFVIWLAVYESTDRKSTRLNSSHLGIYAVFCLDRKSTRLNSSHLGISYAVFCLKKKTTRTTSKTYALRLFGTHFVSRALSLR